MPHIVIEYSETLAPVAPALLRAVHQTVTDSGLFDPQAVKARSILFSDYVLPEGARNFMHITVAILEGRSAPEKASLSDAVFATAKRIAPDLDRLSVDIRDMDKTCYRK
jgi:5-carboxymethyl-2-hydroxymuconate isomerase